LAAPTTAPASPPYQPLKKDTTSGAQTKPEESVKQEAASGITASDIGEFPDRNVAESLQRIPGVNMTSHEENKTGEKLTGNADPEQLLQHIRDLRKQGKQREAKKAWQQFCKQFPDYPVAEGDIARSDKE